MPILWKFMAFFSEISMDPLSSLELPNILAVASFKEFACDSGSAGRNPSRNSRLTQRA